MRFEEKVLFGWNVMVRYTDCHKMFENGSPKESQKAVSVGDHV